LNLLFASVYADGEVDTTVYMTISSGYWTDSAGHVHMFLFDSGWTVELQNDVLPDPPTTPHVCEEFNSDCVCKRAASPNFAGDAEYQRYADVSDADFLKDYGGFENWIDLSSWGAESWQKTRRGPGGKTLYFIEDSTGEWFNIQGIFEQSDAFLDAIMTTVDEINQYMADCRAKYEELNTCDNKEPQHRWVVSSCGTISWKVCARYSSHKEGSESHSYPGGQYNESTHSCKCGKGEPEEHGVLVVGERTATDTGWTEERMCPKGCGYSKLLTHTHEFENCEPCKTEDCGEPCKCGGEHKFGEATADSCAKCECEASEGCNAAPPADDISLHAGWHPCAKDSEPDNDDGTANGAHCRCQCLTFGHDAGTDHNYVLGGGLSPYEEIPGDHEKHYKRLGQCTRCKQYKKQYEKHSYPEEPNDYDWVADDNCRAEYICKSDGCGHTKYVKGSHKLESSPSVYENISAEVCRRKTKCLNCEGYFKDDTHGHERDAANGCRCKNGCGFSFDHEWVADACGNESCKHCKGVKNGVVATHEVGLHDDGKGNHVCACGVESNPHGPWSDWVVSGANGAEVIYTRKCLVCHFPDSKKIGIDNSKCDEARNFHLPKDSECGCVCGKNDSSSDKKYHKWEGSSGGVDYCMCKCGMVHEFRAAADYGLAGEWCEKVCASCRNKLKDGSPAQEEDHRIRDASEKQCGCKCRKYGSGGSDGIVAQSDELHRHGDGITVASCQCYGTGEGGKFHWHNPKSRSTCPEVCIYQRPGTDKLGHLAAPDPYGTDGIRAAKSSDHVPLGNGCGCKCGLCDEETASLWQSDTRLHNHLDDAEDKCHCSCERKELVGSGEGGHEWLNNSCTCTCGQKHKSESLNACGFCEDCGRIWDGLMFKDATIIANHSFSGNGCYCDGGCVVNGSNIQHPDGHIFRADECVCVCEDTTREHIVETTRETQDASVCRQCGAVFVHIFVTTACARCGEVFDTNRSYFVGEHEPDCGDENYRSPHSCGHCGCSCENWTSHELCNGHYCSACCSSKPKRNKRADQPSSSDPNKKPTEPPEPYTRCTHVWDVDDSAYSYQCEACGEWFDVYWSLKYCTKCGKGGDKTLVENGEHGYPCTKPVGHDCNYTKCEAVLNDGSTCGFEYCEQCSGGCPNSSDHKVQPGNNGNGNNGGVNNGGTTGGGGGLDDIINSIR
jgi:hypothetical protein